MGMQARAVSAACRLPILKIVCQQQRGQKATSCVGNAFGQAKPKGAKYIEKKPIGGSNTHTHTERLTHTFV